MRDPQKASQQKQIEELTKELEDNKRSHQQQLEEIKATSSQENRELEQNYQSQKQELEQSFQFQISQLEQQLAKLEIYRLQRQIELNSERGVDYTKLLHLLAAGEWKLADKETAQVMLQAASRESQGWLREEDIDNFPCEDLRTINQLWLHYSNGKFGFSVQKTIYKSLGGTRQYNHREVWNAFGDKVRWKTEENWLNYDGLTFNLDKAPTAHLPRTPGVIHKSYESGEDFSREMKLSWGSAHRSVKFLSRLEACNL